MMFGQLDRPTRSAACALKFCPERCGPNRLSFAYGNSPVDYKVLSLIGLAWSTSYLHDGGVAVGPKVSSGFRARSKRHRP